MPRTSCQGTGNSRSFLPFSLRCSRSLLLSRVPGAVPGSSVEVGAPAEQPRADGNAPVGARGEERRESGRLPSPGAGHGSGERRCSAGITPGSVCELECDLVNSGEEGAAFLSALSGVGSNDVGRCEQMSPSF